MDKNLSKVKIGRPVRIKGEKQTKDKIIEVSIDLFAAQGYSNTSVRQISGAIGLTEGSIYRHFSGKEYILEEIFAYAENLIYTPLEFEETSGIDQDISIFRGLLMPLPEIILKVPYVIKIAKIMYSELNHNKKISDYYQRIYVERAAEYSEALFQRQIELGNISPCNPKILAQVFNAFRSDWLEQNFIHDNSQSQDINLLKKNLELSIQFFEQAFLASSTGVDS
jgi:AcrR family transcriptional regulator